MKRWGDAVALLQPFNCLQLAKLCETRHRAVSSWVDKLLKGFHLWKDKTQGCILKKVETTGLQIKGPIYLTACNADEVTLYALLPQ